MGLQQEVFIANRIKKTTKTTTLLLGTIYTIYILLLLLLLLLLHYTALDFEPFLLFPSAKK